MASIANQLAWAAEQLRNQEIPHPRREAELILASLLGYSREQLVVSPDATLRAAKEQHFQQLIEERGKGMPLSYLTGERQFFGLSIEVSPMVLIPRPESELLVEWALERCHARSLQESGCWCCQERPRRSWCSPDRPAHDRMRKTPPESSCCPGNRDTLVKM